MQLAEFFGTMVREFSGAELVNEDVEFANILVFRAIPSMKVRFEK
jgi:hypothetical protein